jgi:hypothetical protein
MADSRYIVLECHVRQTLCFLLVEVSLLGDRDIVRKTFCIAWTVKNHGEQLVYIWNLLHCCIAHA